MVHTAPVGRLIRPLAAILVGAGIVVGLGAGWHWLGKVRNVAHQQVRLGKTLDDRWATVSAAANGRPNPAQPPPAAEPPGTPIGRLYLPTLGLSLVVVEGSDEAQLNEGPGRIVGTQRLGEAGNTGIAGHRYPGVFWDLDRLEPGDPVVLATATNWLVYSVSRTVTVEPDDHTVLAPIVAGAPALLTLVTCEPKLSTAHRLVKQAELVRTEPRDGPRPKEMSVRSRR